MPVKTIYMLLSEPQKNYKIGNHKFSTVGLFSTNDRGKNWNHYGWLFTKGFSVSTVKVNSDRIFYLSAGNGILKSENSGKDWIISTGSDMTECLYTAIDPRDVNTVYAAISYGIFKTVNGGKDWEEKNNGLTSTFTPVVFFDKSDPDVLFCATESGIHKSNNGGDLWEPIALLGLGIRRLIQHPVKTDLFAAATEDDGVFISQNHGKTWEKRNNGLKHKTVYALAFSPQDENIIYAGTYEGGVYKSLNCGQEWMPVNNGLTNLEIHSLLVDPSDKNTIYAGTLGDGVWMTQNAGKSWRFIGLETCEVWDIVYE